METEKVSVSLPVPLVRFVEQYQQSHDRKSRAQVIVEALELLRQRELEQAYLEASREVDPAWDITCADGLADEAR